MQVDNLQNVGELLFISSFAGDSVAFVLLTIFILIMHYLMPNVVLEKYFKPPYFNKSECIFFTGVPFAPLRTIMFMRVIAYPGSGKKKRGHGCVFIGATMVSNNIEINCSIHCCICSDYCVSAHWFLVAILSS